MRSEYSRSSRRSRAVSVSSRVSALDCSPDEARTRRTLSAKRGSAKSRADTFTLT